MVSKPFSVYFERSFLKVNKVCAIPEKELSLLTDIISDPNRLLVGESIRRIIYLTSTLKKQAKYTLLPCL